MIHEVTTPGKADLVRPFDEIKQSGLEKYYCYFEERAAIREFEGGQPRYDGKDNLANSAVWQAMNDTVYLFMEDNSLDVTSVEVNQFIKKMVL